jgi:Xaa-Pro aminopeptidase
MPIEAARAVTGGKAPRQHGAMEYSAAPVDLDTVRRYRLGRLRAELKRRDYAGLLLFDQINTRYATDATNMQIWCSHYETRCVFVATEGPVVLFDYAKLPHLTEDLPTIDDYRALPSFYYFAAGPRAEEKAQVFGAQIADLVREHGGGNRRLAVDRLSHLGVDALRAQGLEVMAGEAVAEDARAVKSAEELELMRASISVCEAGMDARSPRTRSGPGCTRPISAWAASGSRPGCCPRARAPTPGSANVPCAPSRGAIWSASIPI